MEAKHLNWKQIAVLSFGVVMAAIVIGTHEEPQVSAENPKQKEVIRSLVQDREAGTYSLRSVSEE
jgi:hypothetical protein